MKNTYTPAIVSAVVLIGWLVSGLINQPDLQSAASISDLNQIQGNAITDKLTRVRAQTLSAVLQTVEVIVRGRTEASEIVDVRAETGGSILALPVPQGAKVNKGDVICQIVPANRPEKLIEARAAVEQAEIEYHGFKQLQDNGLQSDINMAAASTRLANKKSVLKMQQLDFEHTFIAAPYAGIVENLAVDRGAYMQVGSVCAQVINLDPLLITGEVSENDIGKLTLGTEADISLLDGRNIKGNISFISKNAGTQTRSYRIEIRAPNPDFLIPAGLTASIKIIIGHRSAHLISSALLALDDFGGIGIRIIDAHSQVVFQPIKILKTTDDGLWVTGLPKVVKVITVGQELVVPSETVEVDLEPSASRLGGDPTIKDPFDQLRSKGS